MVVAPEALSHLAEPNARSTAGTEERHRLGQLALQLQKLLLLLEVVCQSAEPPLVASQSAEPCQSVQVLFMFPPSPCARAVNNSVYGFSALPA